MATYSRTSVVGRSIDAYLQYNFGDKTTTGRIQIRGDLWSMPLGGPAGPDRKHALAITHDFDYINNEVIEYGGQGLGVALFSRFGSPETRLTTRLTATGIFGAAVDADYSFLADIPNPRELRDYDYGLGVGGGFEAFLMRDGHELARFDYRYSLIHVQNGSLYNPVHGPDGSDARHHVHRAQLQLVVPVSTNFGIGAAAKVFYRDSRYDAPDLLNHTQRNPELRFYLVRAWR